MEFRRVLFRSAEIVLALPKGRILREVMPLLKRAGIAPEPAFDDPESRALRFATSLENFRIIRVRSFDVATFVTFGAAQLGIAGSAGLMAFAYKSAHRREGQEVVRKC